MNRGWEKIDKITNESNLQNLDTPSLNTNQNKTKLSNCGNFLQNKQ